MTKRIITTVTVTMRRGRPAVAVEPPDAPVAAAVEAGERLLRVSLRGRGDAVLRFAGCAVRDLDVRGGYALVEPGEPYVARGRVDGWLSLTARLHTPRTRR